MRATPENAARLLTTLRAFGFSELSLSADDFTRPNSVVQLGRPPNRIDILTSISGVNFQQSWDHRIPAELDGLAVSYLGLQTLIANKQASGRDKDLADVSKLQAIARQLATPEGHH